MTFGEQLKQARKAANLTQSELAQIVESTKAAISRYEKNQRIPRSDIFLRLCFALNLDSDQVLSLAGLAGFTPPQVASSVDSLVEWLDIKDKKMVTEMKASRAQLEVIDAFVALQVENHVAETLVSSFFSLNSKGQSVAAERVEELTKIPDYQRTEDK